MAPTGPSGPRTSRPRKADSDPKRTIKVGYDETPTPGEEGGASPPLKTESWRPGIELIQGRQVIRGYSITKDQLDNLAHLGWLVTMFMSIATGSFGYAISLASSIQLASGVNKEVVAWWSGLNVALFVASGLFLIGGLLMGLKGQSTRSAILNNTTFPGGDTLHPKTAGLWSRIRLAIWLVVKREK